MSVYGLYSGNTLLYVSFMLFSFYVLLAANPKMYLELVFCKLVTLINITAHIFFFFILLDMFKSSNLFIDRHSTCSFVITYFIPTNLPFHRCNGKGRETGGEMRWLCLREVQVPEEGAAGARPLVLHSRFHSRAVLLLQERGLYYSTALFCRYVCLFDTGNFEKDGRWEKGKMIISLEELTNMPIYLLIFTCPCMSA